MDDAFEVEVQPVGGGAARRPGRRLLRAGLLVAGLVAGAGVLFGTNTIRFDRAHVPVRHTNRIAFVDDAGGLNAIGADGSNRQAYEIAGAAFLFPAWSPDGTHIAAIGGDPSSGAIYILDDASQAAAASAAPEPVVAYGRSSESPIYLYWSPDGRRIAFITSEPDGLALQTVVTDGSALPIVVRRGQPMYWAWVDDAHLLVHSGGDAQDAFVGEVGLDASPATPIGGAIGQFQAPGISSSGDYRAYVVATSDAARVVVEARRGSTRVEAAVVGASALGWSPAGDQLAFTAPAQSIGLPVGSLRLIDAPSGSTRTLLDGLVVAYFWSPDARTIAALHIVVAGGETAAAAPIAPAVAASLRLSFVDVATGAIRSERAVVLPNLVLSQFLPFFDQYALSHRLWSPASDAIVLPLVDSTGQSHITILPADGSEPRRLADGVAAFWSP